MAKLTLNTLSTLRSDTALEALNENFSLIITSIEGTLSRDGTSPNAMTSTLDMNSNRIINLPEPVNQNEAVRLQDLQNTSLIFGESVRDAVEDILDAILPTGDIVGNSDTQILTNKTIDGDLNTLQDIPTSALKTKTGVGSAVVTGAAGVDGNISQWNTDGDLIDAGIAVANVVTPDSSSTFTNKVFNANGTGNSLTNVEVADLATAAKTGSGSTKVVTGTTGSTDHFLKWNSTGDAVDGGAVPTGAVVGISDSQTLTNKTIVASSNTLTALATSMFAANVIDTDSTFTANSDTRLPTQKAVNTAIAAAVVGFVFKSACRVATTVAGTLATAFENGDTVDGVVLATGDRILVKDQAAPAENGIRVVQASGAPTRATDMDDTGEFVNATVTILSGSLNSGSQWRCTNTSAPTVDTTAITFVQTGTGAISYLAGTALTLTGNTFAFDFSNATYLSGIANQAKTNIDNSFTAVQTATVGSGAAFNAISTDSSNSGGPNFRSERHSPSPAANDFIGGFTAFAWNSVLSLKNFTAIRSVIITPTDGAEDGLLTFETIQGGTVASKLVIKNGVYTTNATGGDKGQDTLNAGTLYQNGVLVPDITFLTTNSSTARSNRDRWSDTVYVMDHGLDPTGVTANFNVALSNAVSEALARNRSTVRVPSGLPNLGGTCTIINENLTKFINIVGEGHATRVKKNSGTGVWFQIGSNANELAGTRTGGIRFHNMTIDPSITQTADEIFNAKFSKDIGFYGIQMGSVPGNGISRAFNFGEGAALQNNTQMIDIIDCPIVTNGTTNMAAILLGSGASLNIRGGGRYDGNDVAGRYFIEHTDATQNWDGLGVYDQFMAGFERYLSSTGKGVGNVVWTGGQCDGAIIAFNANPVTGGQNTAWDISGVQILNTPSDTGTTQPLLWMNDGGGQSLSIKFTNNRIKNYKSYIHIDDNTSVANLNGNTFQNCGRGTGSGGTELIRWGGRGTIIGNTSFQDSGVTAPTFGVNFITPSSVNRLYANNLWIGAGADHTGTP